ncbi:hypothetical protein QV13_12695 [Mesorhizobium hungaricum]|uniref:Uncharacterized protein n=2 Tax=Phyllobacteriaceae TaxID=69277 RepID=A0A1C2DS51_9HYPH|nr:hypothetical protein QV13_12695 [Mesorhizobium hungaricum]
MSGPWMKFYPSDWRADPALRMCSMAARGLWIEMLCVMHEAEPRGHLLVNGNPVTERQLAALAGVSLKEAGALVGELEQAGVFSRDDNGTVYSRRMKCDEEKANQDKANGKRGGNPKLNRGVNPPDKAQKPEARNQKETTPSGVVSGALPPADLEMLTSRLLDAAGENIQPHGALVVGPILELITQGVDLETDILPTVRSRASRLKRPAGSWAYFVDAIRDAHAQRLEAGRGVTKPVVVDVDDERWAKRLRLARERLQWSTAEWGPAPGILGSRVPQNLIQPGDGQGWSEWKSEAA